MLSYKKILAVAIPLLGMMVGCTKLNETLNSNLTQAQAANVLNAQLLLNGAYVDLITPFNGQDQVFSLEENASDESLVPTRGGDWDDNGVWRVIHNHTWNADHAQVLNVFNSLNKLNFDATNVLTFKTTKKQAAEARFLRAYTLYYLLDLYGQYPVRNPGDNLLNPPTVLKGAAGMNFIISELYAVLPDLSPADGTNKTIATQDAAKTLLMHCYLQRGAIANRAAPTFASSDMDSVIYFGNQVMSNPIYGYAADYFDNFKANNGSSPEIIFAYPNSSGNVVNSSGIQARWMMTLHYNSYTPQAPNAGWNGFSTMSDFYNTFGVNALGPVPTTYSMADSVLDARIGLRYNKNITPYAGIRPGMLVGQQYDAAGNPEKDRKGNALKFIPTIASNMIETTDSTLERTGIRVVKYVPDFTDASGKFYSNNSGNWLVLMRYPDVVLMVAEAQMRKGNNAQALLLVNQLRAARNAPALASMTLVNPSNVDDPTTLLAERGRELYWESYRRTDLIRFGVFLKPWQYKPNDDPKNLVYPIPSQALASNPNLTQNPGY